ncbi:hypothetical protein GOBAR_AA01224 [Gossypium barbadense]|uniref:Uncharacterized protein n=1 Tax=Gossypium barbadense TaxID=3634 RepID=A0A2P5YUV3_GOSBA|nr:hypothetical protein GOBAR_AA01224 [Gossypium barbadense]
MMRGSSTYNYFNKSYLEQHPEHFPQGCQLKSVVVYQLLALQVFKYNSPSTKTIRVPQDSFITDDHRKSLHI